MDYFKRIKNKISTKIKRRPRLKLSKGLIYGLFIGVLIVSFAYMIKIVSAETSGGSPESGVTSRIKTLYEELSALSYGADIDAPDWGTYWNRIKTAAKWAPDGTVTTDNVATGITFYNNSRTAQTGTNPLNSSCPNQQWYDSHAAATKDNNCVTGVVWTTAQPAVTGDDAGGVFPNSGNKDPRTGLVWSKYLKNNAGTVEFVATGGSTWSWDASAANNVAVGSKTASQLCSERGSGWRLPSHKELLQAYIDGTYWNLSNPANTFWSRTEHSATYAYATALDTGNPNNGLKTTSSSVRCVR